MDRRILLVEDNPDDEALTLRALRRNDVADYIDVARDGAEAIERLIGAGPHADPLPQLILLDLKLRKVDGLEVLRRLRADDRTGLVPIIILTSSDEESDLIASYASGVNSYVRKPVDFARFDEAVRQLGLFWMVWNRPPPAREAS